MKVLAISGSPHPNGLTAKLVEEAAKGAEEAGAKVERIRLAEKKVLPCRACPNSPCWTEMDCAIKDDDGLELRRLLNEADALIFGAPVYFLSVNGLAKDFMDRMRTYGEGGKPALPIAVAGGTGKGCITAVQEICRWMAILGFRPLSPLPVTRYDFDIALVEARQRGRRLCQEPKKPYEGLADIIAYCESLPFMRYGMAEELAYLARIAIEAICRKGRPEEASGAREKLEQGLALIHQGRYHEALPLLAQAQEESMEIFNRLS